MAGVRSFTDLLFWQRARQWSKRIFWLTKTRTISRRPAACRANQRLVRSVTANIAEGFGRGTQGEFVLFLGYSLGSLDETRSYLCTAYDRDYLTKDEFAELFKEGTEIRR